MKDLEDELDGLYNTYQDRLRERDAKYRVKEARKNDKSREEWGGIKEKGSDDEDDESDEEGGWDQQQARKAKADSDSDWSIDLDEPPSKVRAHIL